MENSLESVNEPSGSIKCCEVLKYTNGGLSSSVKLHKRVSLIEHKHEILLSRCSCPISKRREVERSDNKELRP
jgi:hypothetical protein